MMMTDEHWEDDPEYDDSPETRAGVKQARAIGLSYARSGERYVYEVSTGRHYKTCEIGDELLDELWEIVTGARCSVESPREHVNCLDEFVTIERAANGFVVRYPAHMTEGRDVSVFQFAGTSGEGGRDEAEALLRAVKAAFPVEARLLEVAGGP
jgi:hypothetical protein